MMITSRLLTFAALLAALASSAIALRADAQGSYASQRTVAKMAPGFANGGDPFLWLEQVHGSRALAWVRAQDAKTVAVLEHDPHYATLYADSLKIVESKSRIPSPEYIGGRVYNFWQDQHHVRGILRRTTLAEYAKPTPAWTTVLDLDAVAKAEEANWVYEGIQCPYPDERRCLIFLSDGGEDAVTIREFDLTSNEFVQGGFMLPRGKQNVTWENDDTLLVAREWNPGELTSSGYPYIVKRLARGQALSSATELFRGTPTDVGVQPFVLDDGSGNRVEMIERDVTFFTGQYYLIGSSGVQQIGVPQKIQISGLVDGRLLVRLNQSWTVNGRTFGSGSLVALDLAALKADPAHLAPTLVFAPGPRESIDDVEVTKDRVLIADYLNVRGKIMDLAPAAGDAWTSRELPLPDNSTVGVVATELRSDTVFVDATSFLVPTTLYLVNAAAGTVEPVKSRPALFDASNDVVEQHEATSKDGTKIPYFIVHPKSMALDGTNPTVIDAYGGFQISSTPNYDGETGKLWLERGGVYVLANIRGGGEFGPAWHEAGLKTHRQRIYDDFYAVARDLVSRKITSPRYLGIEGASNGGLLMGVEFTQHPEMYNAVDIGVPLLDMLRFEKIEAGASWVAEYGSVSVPAERAFLASISPYQNLRGGVAYPEPFIWTTTKDDRVGPEHARKFAAKLAAMGVPYLFYEVTEGGHGAGANLGEDARTFALQWTYFTERLMGDGAR